MINMKSHKSSNNDSNGSLISNLSDSEISVSRDQKRKGIVWKSATDSEDKDAVYREINLVECLANIDDGAMKTEIWYEGKELGTMRKKEIKKVKHAQIMAGTGTIESDELTWRGFEDIQGCWCRVEKSADYTTAVVKHYHSQVHQGYSDPEELKKIAKGLSKQERTRARNLAIQDAKDVGMNPGSSKPSTIRRARSNASAILMPSSGGSNNSLKRISSSGGLKKVKSSAGMKKVGSINSLRLGVQKARKSVSSLGNFQWGGGVKKNGTTQKMPPLTVYAA